MQYPHYSQPSVIWNSFIRKPCYPDRIFRNGTLTMGNTLIFPEICFLDPELNFLDKTYDFLYKFPRLSRNQKTRLSNFPDFLLPTIEWTFENDCTVTFVKQNRPITSLVRYACAVVFAIFKFVIRKRFPRSQKFRITKGWLYLIVTKQSMAD